MSERPICPGVGRKPAGEGRRDPYRPGWASMIYPCPGCGSRFTLDDKGHMRRHTVPKDKMSKIARECPNCNQSKVIPEGDFLCEECRDGTPLEINMVGQVDDEMQILSLTFTKEQVTIAVRNSRIAPIIIRKVDLSSSALEGFAKFTKS